MRLTSLLQTAIRQSLWDALLEYRMLSAPLALPNLSQNIMEAMEDTEVGQEDVKESTQSTSWPPTLSPWS